MKYITKKELETPRTAAHVRSWADGKFDEIGTTDEGKHALRFREGLLKEIVEETLPLGIFCDLHFNSSEGVTVTHVVGNQNHDVVIEDNRENKGSLLYLEITQAHEGEDAHLRMLKLEEKGHVNSLGAVKKTGTKHSGISIEVENEAVKHDVIFEREAKRIKEAAKRKSGKEYPDHTGLVIVCDDYIAFRSAEDKDRLAQFVANEVIPMLDNFVEVFIIGWSGNTYLEFK